MEKRLKNYLAYMAEFVEKDHSDEEYERGYRDLMIQIAFFQHERLIHLIVTVTFALLALIGITAALATPQIPLLILVMLFIVLLVPYVRHYYILENGVQELYRRYDTIVTHIPTEKIKYRKNIKRLPLLTAVCVSVIQYYIRLFSNLLCCFFCGLNFFT